MYHKTILRAIQEGLDIDKNYWQDKKVIIVGAGSAGLTAGEILAKSEIDFTVLEASNTFGGRIRSLESFADIPIELGAEWIHGKYSIWHDLVKSLNINIRKDEIDLENYYQIDEELKSSSKLEEDEGFQIIEEVYEDLENYQGDTLNLKDYFDEINLPESYRYILETWLDSEYGTSYSKIDLKSLAESMHLWSSGLENYKTENHSFHKILEKCFTNTLLKTQFAQPVVKIDYSSENIFVYTESGQKLEADKVILTVPLIILKQGFIEFKPELPEKKQEAIQGIGMDKAGMKIILKFKEKFWTDDTHTIHIDSVIPELYTHPKSQGAILTGYIMGEKAKYLHQNQDEILNIVLEILNRFYDKISKEDIIEHYVMDWSKESFIQGSYSYPTPNSTQNRKILAQPLDNKLFFAGEASNTRGHFATVHGAIESGFRAIEQMIKLV